MRMNRHAAVLVALILVFPGGTRVAGASDYTRQQWWPSEWGADDQLGALNRLTPAKVLEATQLITTGTIYDMTFVYE